ncbi:uncharacterized protein C8A04DRAFT_32730 [Dichotomopilus funicola]|uniref:Uncharacterized protein n=1 Tax=Dichotomopilus funicola TaxID=1934379 RepID=A0AAN6UVX5_9PEZI|nr:hypothetical protein C8A04DRAFT_32730 [Dichotomopilus funicola]
MEPQTQAFGVGIDSQVGVSQTTFTTTTGVFFALALLSVLVPTTLGLRTKWTPSFADYSLHAGAIFLSGAAGLLYSMSDNLYYLAAAAEYTPSLAQPNPVSWKEASAVAVDVMKRSEAFSILAWTSVFAVRCSLLAVSGKRYGAGEPWLRQYSCGATVVAVVSWLVCVVASPFVVSCVLGVWVFLGGQITPLFDTYTPLSTATTALDVLTAIAIIILELVQLSRRRSQRFSDAEEIHTTTTTTTKPQTSQPIPLSLFFLLSLAGISFAAVRASTPSAATHPPLLPWINFWQFLEACTTICAGAALSMAVPNHQTPSPPAADENETAENENTIHPSNATYPTRTHTKDEKQTGWNITTWAMDRKASASTVGANDIAHTHSFTAKKHGQYHQEEDDAIGPLATSPRDKSTRDTPTPRRPPIAYHYPTWTPQSTQDQEAVEAQMAAGQTLVWCDPLLRRASQTSFGGVTLMDRRGSEQTASGQTGPGQTGSGYPRHGSVSSVRS